MFAQKVDYEPLSVDIHPGQTEVAVGGQSVSFVTRPCCLYLIVLFIIILIRIFLIHMSKMCLELLKSNGENPYQLIMNLQICFVHFGVLVILIIIICGIFQNALKIYTLSNDTLVESKSLILHHGSVTDVKYSPDGTCLATCDNNKKVATFKLPDYEVTTFIMFIMRTHLSLILDSVYLR